MSTNLKPEDFSVVSSSVHNALHAIDQKVKDLAQLLWRARCPDNACINGTIEHTGEVGGGTLRTSTQCQWCAKRDKALSKLGVDI